MLPRSLHIRLALAAALILLFTAQFRLYSGWAIDDPWISFQYARHLVEGKGLVFNPGERVEGYSNFLWVMQMAAAHRMGIDMLTAAKTLGFVFGLLPILLLGATAAWSGLSAFRGSKPEEAISTTHFLGGLLLATSGMWAFWAAGGLETVQFATLAALAILMIGLSAQMFAGYEAQRIVDLNWPGRVESFISRTAAPAALIMLMTAMSRPEGAMFGYFALVMGAFYLWKFRSEKLIWRQVGRFMVAMVIFFLVPFVIYTFWRRWYFGQWLPNTYYAKAVAPLDDQIESGLEYVIKYLVLFSLPIFAGLGVWIFTLQGGAMKTIKRLGGVMILLYFLFIVKVGGDWMPMGRFIVQIMPALAFVAGAGIFFWWKSSQSSMPARIIFIVSLAATLLISGWYQYRETAPILERVRAGAFWRPLVTAGEWLRENSPEDAVVAGEEAGIIPFTSRRRFIDMLGIVEPHIARINRSLHEKYDAAYVLGREPDFILLHVTKDTGEGVYDSSRDMLAQAAFRTGYAEAHRITIGLASLAEKPEHYNDLVIYQRIAEERNSEHD